jgi:hypothetical protein
VSFLSVLTQALAVIGGEDNQGVIQNFLLRKRLLEAPDRFVDVGNFGIVAAVGVCW